MTVIAAHNSPDVPDIPLHKILPSLTPPENHTLLKLLRALPQAQRLLQDCDVLHATAEPYAPLAALIAGNRPLFVTAHGSYVHLPRIRRFPVNRLYAWAFAHSRLICVSHYTAKIAAQVVPNIQTIVIPNAVNAARFAPRAAMALDTKQLYPAEKPIILSSGGVKARKGTLHLVRAVAKVRETFPQVRCIVTGSLTAEPVYVAQVRAEIAALNLTETVTLAGFLPENDLVTWYHAADVFVLPAMNSGWKFEGFGLVYLEASAAGLPVIGTTDCGAEDAIREGVTGILVKQAQVDDLLPGAILELLKQPEKARRMGDAGRQHAQQYTPALVAQQVLAAYGAALPE
jgi:glycosyltransferase involved in cell wall biosynthesis